MAKTSSSSRSYRFELAEGLDYAHRYGLVHRDLKPANVKLGDRVKVLDFGLAKTNSSSASDSTVTAAIFVGVILGTAAYMSPEQASGNPADARSDVFSFGVCPATIKVLGRKK